MASISKRKTASGNRYDVNYREPDGRRRRRTFRRSVDAERFVVTVEADKLRGVYVDPNAGRVLLRDYAREWLAAQTFSESSRVIVERALRLHVFPVLGDVELSALRPTRIQAWLKGLDRLSANYAGQILTHLRTILSAAVDDELIPKNPAKAKSVRAPKIDSEPVVVWTVEQVGAMLREMSDRFRIAAQLAAGLGLRQGEVFGLAVTDVDFLRGTVKVRRQVKTYGGHRHVFALPKGGKTREVPLPASVRDALAVHLAAIPAVEVTLPWEVPSGRPVTVPLVLTSVKGNAVQRDHFNRTEWWPARERAGISSDEGNGMHALRHHYASVLLDRGETPVALAEYLGHSDPGFTIRKYTHLMPNSAGRTRAAVDAAFARYMTATSGGTESHVSAV